MYVLKFVEMEELQVTWDVMMVTLSMEMDAALLVRLSQAGSALEVLQRALTLVVKSVEMGSILD